MGIKSNNLAAIYHDFFSRSGKDAVTPVPVPILEGLTATGGIISDYLDGSTYYRAHIFTSSGTFDVTAPGAYGDTVEYLVVAGGGGGGYNSPSGYGGGGGGAGGLRTNLSGHPLAGSAFPVSPGSYTVTVGGGGIGGSADTVPGTNGIDSSFGPITSTGGGYGASNNNSHPGAPIPAQYRGGDGGSGGGGVAPADDALSSSGNTPPVSPPQGNGGGATYSSNVTPYPYTGGGGGGAGADGTHGSVGGSGGAGVQVAIAGPSASTTGVGALNPGPGEYQWFAGGGGGASSYHTNLIPGGVGGGGNGDNNNANTMTPGTYSTGGGGGSGKSRAAAGGSGIVVVRYQIGQLTAVQKATGGAISYYNGKTIHVFTSSGTFATESNWTATNVEYVIVGGGGAGGNGDGGGGGAGAYRTGTTPIGAHPVSTSIQVGAGGFGNHPHPLAIPTGGSPSYFGTPITSPGGGAGGSDDQYTVPAAGGAGGSGGGGGGGFPDGAAGPAPGATSFPGTIGATPPSSWWGHAGGAGRDNVGPAPYSGGGGGGAGGAGAGAPEGNYGGVGVQLPTTFRNPEMASGASNPPYYNSGGGGLGAPGPTSPPFTGADTSGKFWVAGGGGGARINPGTESGEGRGGAGGGGWGGGPIIHPGTGGNWTYRGAPGAVNTGGGGGGGDDTQGIGGNGGSGIVIIAYPS